MNGINDLVQTEKDSESWLCFDIDAYLARRRGQLILKRGFDIIFSSLGLIILSPLFLIIILIIKTGSKGPVFFTQTRVGKDGKEFKIIKFRTMEVDAEKKGMQITVGQDSRITKEGKWLRKFKLDELPQLINVLVGDMSFVGPRPEVPKYVGYYDDYQRNILKVKPGITDLASIEFRAENELLGRSADPEKTYIEEIMPAKFRLNLKYLKNMTLLNDVKIIMKTILVLLLRK